MVCVKFIGINANVKGHRRKPGKFGNVSVGSVRTNFGREKALTEMYIKCYTHMEEKAKGSTPYLAKGAQNATTNKTLNRKSLKASETVWTT